MIRGRFDNISGREVCGWLWDPAQPLAALVASVYINGQLVAQGLANHYRPDLQSAGIGEGQHAFFIRLPDEWTHGQVVALAICGPSGQAIDPTPVEVRLPALQFQPVQSLGGSAGKLAICAIVRNEADYLIEWIAWHRLVGVSRFLIFDNASTDGTTTLLANLARTGVVDHVPWPDIDSRSPQVPAYTAGLARLDTQCHWVAFIDADEFLTPLQVETVPQILASYPTAAGLVVPWRLFGSSGHAHQTPGLVIERFTHRGSDNDPLNHAVKTIVQPHLVMQAGVHTPQLRAGSLIDEFGQVAGIRGNPNSHPVPDAKRLVVSHFFTKSRQEWERKRMRGQATEIRGTTGWLRPDHHFAAHDLNSVRDVRLLAKAPQVHDEIRRLRALLRLKGN